MILYTAKLERKKKEIKQHLLELLTIQRKMKIVVSFFHAIKKKMLPFLRKKWLNPKIEQRTKDTHLYNQIWFSLYLRVVQTRQHFKIDKRHTFLISTPYATNDRQNNMRVWEKTATKVPRSKQQPRERAKSAANNKCWC